MKKQLWNDSISKLHPRLLAVVGLAAVTYWSAASLIQSANALADRDAISENLQALRFNLTEVESAHRGYVLTGGAGSLAQYQGASSRVALSIDALRGLTKDSPGQQGRLDALEPLIGQQLDLLAKSIEERRSKGFDLTQQAVVTSRAQDLTHRIQKEVLSMAEQEDKVFAIPRSEAKEAAAKRTLALLITGNLLALVIVGSALYRADTESALRAAADAELSKSRAWQEFLLQAGTKGLPVTDEAASEDHLIQTSRAK
jgi:CHASE3 domain sensor protein